MGQTLIQKIIGAHTGKVVEPGEIVDLRIDTRIARDFGGASVVKNIEEYGLGIDDPESTYFTFDCNPTGSDQRYATNQQKIRMFAERQGIRVYDINAGIGTHIAMDEGLVGPGGTLVSTDSHANIVGAIGAFGQGMGDQDIAYAFAAGRVWFKVPPSVKLRIEGDLPDGVTAKDVTLALCGKLGSGGLLGYAADVYGEGAERMGLSDRVTLSSMATEMGGIIVLFPPNERILAELKSLSGKSFEAAGPDKGAEYVKEIVLDLGDLEPLTARPGSPSDVVPVSEARGTPIHSAFIGSCTNGRYEDIAAAAEVLRGRRIDPGVVLKIVPSTDGVWRRCLMEGILSTLKEAGALIGNAGCAGCAAGQIGQNGPGEITISTGNRNFPGKQGQGEVYLASPEVVAASAVRGMIVAPAEMDTEIARKPLAAATPAPATKAVAGEPAEVPEEIKGRVWMVTKDNIDTDMIYHNRHLAVTDIEEMGRHCFGNLEGWKDFAGKVKPGDIVVTGSNFGCGSSRQHAVDCFKSLGVQAVIARSFGAIYERNAINAGLPILEGDLGSLGLEDGDEITVNLKTGEVRAEATGKTVSIRPFSEVQAEIYRRGGLLRK
jgi:3-isopropylmalate dehydratase small subunit